jgi:hypothetical protein
MFESPVKGALVVRVCRGVATVLCVLGDGRHVLHREECARPDRLGRVALGPRGLGGDVRHVLHREECARPGRLGKVVLGPRGLGGDVRIALQPVTCA